MGKSFVSQNFVGEGSLGGRNTSTACQGIWRNCDIMSTCSQMACEVYTWKLK